MDKWVMGIFVLVLILFMGFAVLDTQANSIVSAHTTFTSNTNSCANFGTVSLVSQGLGMQFKTVDTNNVSITLNFGVEVGAVAKALTIQMVYGTTALAASCGAHFGPVTSIGNAYQISGLVDNNTYSYTVVISGLSSNTAYMVDLKVTQEPNTAVSTFLNPQMTILET